jgi:hypothetical protein
MNRKYSDEDYEMWQYLYIEKCFSCQQISDKINVPVSTIKKHLKKKYLLRTNRESKKGRTPWNQGKKTNQTPWNKGMKGNYPYPSPFLGKKSPFKNIPRDLETKQKIAQTLRKQRWNGSRFYEEYANRLDTLYLCRLKSDDLLFYKIGRTFGEPKRRCGKHLDATIQIWQSSHKEIVDIERQVFLTYQDQYGWIAPNYVSGRTECFTIDLPIDQVCQFIDMAISSQAKGTPLEGSETTGEVKSS